MQLILNGSATRMPAGATVADLVGDRTTGIAVAVNDEVVPRSTWAAAQLRPGDRVEILEPRQGG